MNIFKAFLGILLAFSIITCVVSALAYANAINDYFAKFQDLDLIYHFITTAILFFSLVLLTTYFVPPPKKTGASISTVLSYLLFMSAIYW